MSHITTSYGVIWHHLSCCVTPLYIYKYIFVIENFYFLINEKFWIFFKKLIRYQKNFDTWINSDIFKLHLIKIGIFSFIIGGKIFGVVFLRVKSALWGRRRTDKLRSMSDYLRVKLVLFQKHWNVFSKFDDETMNLFREKIFG